MENTFVLTPHVAPVSEISASTLTADETSTAQVINKRDSYTRSEDGHYIGHDGFVVPANFAEFYERFPDRTRKFVVRLCPRASSAEIEDRTSEILLYLMHLPEKSKFRKPGCNGLPGGCVDRIQAFNPDSAYGASAPRFFAFVNNIILNHYCSLDKRAIANPVRRYSTLSLYSCDSLGTIVDEDYLYLRASEAKLATDYDQLIEDGVFVREYVDFVKEHNPELMPVIDSIQLSDSFVDAQRTLGMTERLFTLARNRLIVLYTCFEKGTRPPRQRKIYRDRVPSTRVRGTQKMAFAI